MQKLSRALSVFDAIDAILSSLIELDGGIDRSMAGPVLHRSRQAVGERPTPAATHPPEAAV